MLDTENNFFGSVGAASSTIIAGWSPLTMTGPAMCWLMTGTTTRLKNLRSGPNNESACFPEPPVLSLVECVVNFAGKVSSPPLPGLHFCDAHEPRSVRERFETVGVPLAGLIVVRLSQT